MNRNINELKKINRLIKKISKLNENISFDDDLMEDDDESFEEYESDINNELPNEEMPKDKEEMQCQNNNCDDLVNKIRKMALSGMSDLAEDTNNPNYEVLKKIWQFCDKKITDDKKNSLEIDK